MSPNDFMCIGFLIAWPIIIILVAWDPTDWQGLRALGRRIEFGSYGAYNHIDLRAYYDKLERKHHVKQLKVKNHPS